jgi:hypothetical protein
MIAGQGEVLTDGVALVSGADDTGAVQRCHRCSRTRLRPRRRLQPRLQSVMGSLARQYGRD